MMDQAYFRRNFPSDATVPDRLRRLLDFQNGSRDWYSGHFELCEWEYGNPAWFAGDQKAAAQFAVFGQGPDGSLYALWLYPGRTIADAPVVFLGSEGVDCGLLANNVDEFLGLLALGVDELGFAVSWGQELRADQPAPRLQEFRAWLRESFGISSPTEPLAQIALARTRHLHFDEWLSAWKASQHA
jgi:hypothetical protein